MNNLRNKVNLVGRLGANPETQNLNGGYVKTRFSLATSERYKDKAGEWKENTSWHNLFAWGKTAERISKALEKGFEVVIDGKLVNNNYETKSGEKRYTTEIEVLDFLIISSTPKTNQSAN